MSVSCPNTCITFPNGGESLFCKWEAILLTACNTDKRTPRCCRESARNDAQIAGVSGVTCCGPNIITVFVPDKTTMDSERIHRGQRAVARFAGVPMECDYINCSSEDSVNLDKAATAQMVFVA